MNALRRPAIALLMSGLSAAAAGATPTVCDSLTTYRYDTIYVCPDSLKNSVQRLAIYRSQAANGGYSSIVVGLNDLATGCSFGPGRGGIRAMMANAIQTWSPKPKYLVLVGAFANSDTSDYLIPTWHINDQTMTFWTSGFESFKSTPTDDPYVFGSTAGDSTPVVAVGRLPVWRQSDLDTYVDKVIAYEAAGMPDWKGSALHIIEDRDYDGNSGQLTKLRADSLASSFGGRESAFDRSYLFGSELPLYCETPYLHLCNTSQYAILSAWNAGLGFVFVMSTRGYWDSMAHLLAKAEGDCAGLRACSGGLSHCSSPDSLARTSKTPVVFTLSCGGGYSGVRDYVYASNCYALVPFLLNAKERGAVAVIGPPRAMIETPAYLIARDWFQQCFSYGGPAYVEIGEALRHAKTVAISDLPQNKADVLSFICLGDPALRMAVAYDLTGIPSRTPLPDGASLSIQPLSSPSRSLAFTVAGARPGVYSVQVFDIRGRVVSRDQWEFLEGESTKTFNLRNFGAASGVYFLMAQRGSLIAMKKFVFVR